MSTPAGGAPTGSSSAPDRAAAGDGVVRLELWHVAVPLLAPFEASHGTEERREVVVVRATFADGGHGVGECSALAHPAYTHEYAAGAFALLRDEAGPALLAGRPVPLAFHPMARAALATAVLDRRGRADGVPLAALLGALGAVGDPAPALARTVVLGRADSPDRLLAAVDAARRGGAAMVKLKVGSVADLVDLRLVREAFADLALAADANGALAGAMPDDLLAVGLDDLGLRYLEQPFPAEDLLAAAELRRRSRTPVALDESITSLGALHTAVALGALDVVNVKPARLGGPVEAVEVGRSARAEGLGAFVGGMLELGPGRAMAAVVASSPWCTEPTDLGPSAQYVARDLATPIGCDASGRLVPPSGPGLGVDLDEARLAEVTVQHAVLERR